MRPRQESNLRPADKKSAGLYLKTPRLTAYRVSVLIRNVQAKSLDEHPGTHRDGAAFGAQPHIRHERTLGLLGVLLLSPSPARVVSVGMLAVGTVLALVVGAGMARQADQRER